MLERLVDPHVVPISKPKFMISGDAGVGKTMFALDFPKPILFDAEGGATRPEYQEKLKNVGGKYFGKEHGSQSFENLIELVKSLTTEKHEFKTLIVDSFSYLYMLAAAEAEIKGGSEYGRDKKMANIPTRKLMLNVEKLDLTVIFVTHSKDKWETRGKDRIVVDTTFDGWDKMEFMLDLWIELFRDRKNFLVKKSRVAAFPQDQAFPLTYERFSGLYGKEIMEKESVPVVLANHAQLIQLRQLIETLSISVEQQDKVLTSFNAEKWEELSEPQIQKAIGGLQKKINSLKGEK